MKSVSCEDLILVTAQVSPEHPILWKARPAASPTPAAFTDGSLFSQHLQLTVTFVTACDSVTGVVRGPRLRDPSRQGLDFTPFSLPRS